MGAPSRQRLVELCRDVLRPLIEADEGKLYLVSADDNELALHLGGNCSGCPGAPLTIRTLIEPAARRIHPDVRVVVTVGAKRPEGAVLIEQDGAAAQDGAPDTQVMSGDEQSEATEDDPDDTDVGDRNETVGDGVVGDGAIGDGAIGDGAIGDGVEEAVGEK